MHSEIWQRDGQMSTDLIVTHIDFRLRKAQRGLQRADDIARRCVPLYVKTKVFHWDAFGLRSRGRHLLPVKQAAQVLVTIDTIGEHVRALGGPPRRDGEIEWILTTFYRGLPKLTRQARLRRIY